MTVRLLADENFNRKIVVGLQRRIEDLELVVGASLDGEWDHQVSYLPLR